MPQYMPLLYADEVGRAETAERMAEMPVWDELTNSLREAGLRYHLLECADRDEALGHAQRLPPARHGSVEVRPIAG